MQIRTASPELLKSLALLIEDREAMDPHRGRNFLTWILTEEVRRRETQT